MPLLPTPQQLSSIKRLRQLRHIEVTTKKGNTPQAATTVLTVCPKYLEQLSMHAQPYDAPGVLQIWAKYWRCPWRCSYYLQHEKIAHGHHNSTVVVYTLMTSPVLY